MEKSNPSSPAEELRAAATLLRETAEGTTPTPWRVHLRYYRRNPTVLSGAEFETPLHTSGITVSRPHVLADTRWKALMSPAVAEDLAGLLEAEADTWPTAPAHTSTEPAAQRRRSALAFARMILGRAS